MAVDLKTVDINIESSIARGKICLYFAFGHVQFVERSQRTTVKSKFALFHITIDHGNWCNCCCDLCIPDTSHTAHAHSTRNSVG